MTTCLTLRGFPVELRDELKRRAQASKRSLNAEGVTLLTAALKPSDKLSEKEIFRRIDAFPKKQPSLTVGEMRGAIREGRK